MTIVLISVFENANTRVYVFLSQSKSDAYYIESVRAFEKAFGMDRLEKIIEETQAKRQLLHQDPKKHKNIFESADLQKQIEALEQF